MTTELQQADAVQLREEIGSIRKQVNGLLVRLDEAEQRLNEIENQVPKKNESLNTRFLEDYIVEVLQNSNEPLTAAEVADLVLDNGYKTKAKKNFVSIVLQALVRSPAIRRTTRGKKRPTRYALVNEDE